MKIHIMDTFVRRGEWVDDGRTMARSDTGFGLQIFVGARLRKSARCADCGSLLAAGTRGFRPLTNRYNRGHRYCDGCIVPSRA